MSMPSLPKRLEAATLCVHAGHRAHAGEPSVIAPIAQSSTFLLDDRAYASMLSGRVEDALIYTRIKNPTLDALQGRIAALEGAERTLVFASGMAAIHAAILGVVGTRGRIVAHRHLYGTTWDLMQNFLRPLGIETHFTDLDDAAEAGRVLAEVRPAIVYCESISNPTLSVSDVPRLATQAHAHGAKLLVDASFASPILQRPLALGADLSIHSLTKYLGGHSDVLGGAVSGSEELMRGVFRWLQLAGGTLDPHAAFLVDRGIKTLPLRMRAHAENAFEIAGWLEGRAEVERVLYPWLPSHPSHVLARRVLANGGGMISFVLCGGDEAALRFVRALRLALEASSLGGVETLASLPFNTSHVKLSPIDRAAAGIPPGFVRVSVGIEDARDLIDDFASALDASKAGSPRA